VYVARLDLYTALRVPGNGSGDVEWIHVAQDGKLQRAFVNTVMNTWSP
jgi:hypothetical protein